MDSHCPEHKWASARQLPGRKSIFSPLTKQGGPAEKDADDQRSTSESQLGNEKMVLKVASVVEYASNCELGTSDQVEALDLQGFPRAGSTASRTNDLSTGHMTEVSQGQYQSLPPSTGSLSEEGGGASVGGDVAQERGSKQGSPEPEPGTQCQETGMSVAASEQIRDSASMARKSNSTSKVNSKGLLVGVKRNKKGWIDERSLESRGKAAALRLGFQWNSLHLEAGFPNLAEGELMNEIQSKGNKSILKASPRMNPPEEKKPEEAPGSGPFFYIGGTNGVDIVNLYCKTKGWQRICDNRREDYILKWCEIKFRDTYYNFREGEQLLYQIPNNKLLTTKIGLLVNLREYERVIRKISRNAKLLKMEDFFPETFRLDVKDEKELFFETYSEPQIWICKPTGSNQGRGIFLLKSQEEVKHLQLRLQAIEEDPMYKKLPYRIPQPRIVQRYIDRPLLLVGKKFDVRSYLLIACTVPYMLFFGHGYVRLTCLNYDPASNDLTSHLTNQAGPRVAQVPSETCCHKGHQMKSSNAEEAGIPAYSSHVKEETVWLMDRFNTYVNERFRHAKGLPKDWVFNNFTATVEAKFEACPGDLLSIIAKATAEATRGPCSTLQGLHHCQASKRGGQSWRPYPHQPSPNAIPKVTTGAKLGHVHNPAQKRMKEIMLQCFLTVKSKLECKLGYFDLIGCDFLIDEDFKPNSFFMRIPSILANQGITYEQDDDPFAGLPTGASRVGKRSRLLWQSSLIGAVSEEVWLLEMNANPALHTNCSALKTIIPTVVNETLDLAIELFTKCQKKQPILPLEALRHFVLLYNGATTDCGLARPTKSRTSLGSLHGHRLQTESGTSISSNSSTGGGGSGGGSSGGGSSTGSGGSGGSSNQVMDRPPPKPPKMDLSGPPEGISLPPHKAVLRNTFPVPHIEISIIPNLSSCPSVKAVFRGSQLCSNGSQYVSKHTPESDRCHAGSTKAETGDEKAKSNPVAPARDRSYATWFQQTFGTKYPATASGSASVPLTSSQMVSLHLQSDIPPNVPPPQEQARSPHYLATHTKLSTENSKTAVVAGPSSCSDLPPEDKKASHRGS
uniref:Uncharacterized protein n=1 Tax=Sphaerodactylus townsendi TaxID=933632 RepID=A0ACB8EEH1_9SAUR